LKKEAKTFASAVAETPGTSGAGTNPLGGWSETP
jgi:hypothetical protein